MNGRRSFNPKRRLVAANDPTYDTASWHACRYGGNPEHKSRPADYGLKPATNPRPGKTLCDATGSFPKGRAEALLRAGFARRMVSVRQQGNWPQNVWAVDGSGEAFEAQLENRETGAYHGYPMPGDDPFRELVLKEWNSRVG